MITTRSPRERAYLVGILLPGTAPEAVREQMGELADLARTAGAEVVGSDVQRRSDVDPAHLIGMGKVEALRDMKLEGEFDLVICRSRPGCSIAPKSSSRYSPSMRAPMRGACRWRQPDSTTCCRG